MFSLIFFYFPTSSFLFFFFFFSSRRRHTRLTCDWSSDVCSSDLNLRVVVRGVDHDRAPERGHRVVEERRALPDVLGRHREAEHAEQVRRLARPRGVARVREHVRQLDLRLDPVRRDRRREHWLERTADPELAQRPAVGEIVAQAEHAAREAERHELPRLPQAVRARVAPITEIVRREPRAPRARVERKQDEHRGSHQARSCRNPAHGMAPHAAASFAARSWTRPQSSSFAASASRRSAAVTNNGHGVAAISRRRAGGVFVALICAGRTKFDFGTKRSKNSWSPSTGNSGTTFSVMSWSRWICSSDCARRGWSSPAVSRSLSRRIAPSCTWSRCRSDAARSRPEEIFVPPEKTSCHGLAANSVSGSTFDPPCPGV